MEESSIRTEQKTESKPNNNSKMMLIGGIVLGIALVGGAFLMTSKGSKSSDNSTTQTDTRAGSTQNALPTNTPTPQTTNQPTSGVATNSEERTIDMEAGSFYYSTKEIRVKKGQKVTINFKPVDMMHDFNIDELKVDGPIIKSGDSTVIEFVADKVGRFEYYCSVGQHRKMGQVGTLIVE